MQQENSLFDYQPPKNKFIEPIKKTPSERAKDLKRLEKQPHLYFQETPEPNTSYEAVKGEHSKIQKQRLKVYATYIEHPEGLTDEEVGLILNMASTTAGARRIDLRDNFGLIEYAGYRKPTRSGKTAKAWKIKQ